MLVGSSFLACLVIFSFLIIGLVSIYFSQKITSQNHKINTMFDVITNLTEEVQTQSLYVKSIISKQINLNNNDKNIIIDDNLNSGFKTNNLVKVSDDEEDEDDEDDKDEDEDEVDENDEYDEDDDEDEDDNEYDEDGYYEDVEDEDEFENEKGNVNEDEYHVNNYKKHKEQYREDDKLSKNKIDDNEKENIKYNDKNDIFCVDEKNIMICEKNNQNNETLDSVILEKDDYNKNYEVFNNNDEIQNDTTINDVFMNNTTDNYINLKSINLNSLENKLENTNYIDYDTNEYKKMNISKLRELVQTKGLVEDASKLKKNELLKLLE